MYYQPATGHGLKFDPFKAIVTPRPIGWISTVDKQGHPNIAPYSFFNAMSARPPMIGFTSDGMKHTISNARDTGEFVYNVVGLKQLEAMNLTALKVEQDISEFDLAEIETAPSNIVRPPRVAGAPAALECKVVHFMQFRDIDNRPIDRFMIVGQVVGVHIDDACMVDGRYDLTIAKPVARCGYRDYAVVTEIFEVIPPAEDALQVL